MGEQPERAVRDRTRRDGLAAIAIVILRLRADRRGHQPTRLARSFWTGLTPARRPDVSGSPLVLHAVGRREA